MSVSGVMPVEFWTASAWVSVGAAIGVEAGRTTVVERYRWVREGFEMRSGAETLVEDSSWLVGMRRRSVGRVRESMSGFS